MFETKIAEDGEEALELFESFKPSLILLDLMLPGKDGYQVCREVRAKKDTPIIMLSAKGETFDKVLGLELGADDYVTKPFGVRELLARVSAALRRAGQSVATASVISADFPFCGVTASVKHYRLENDGKFAPLTEIEMKLASLFAAHPSEVLSRDRILNEVWGVDYLGTTRTLDQHVANLRRKVDEVGGDTTFVRTVHGIGYSYA